MQEIVSPDQFSQVLELPLAVLFKHSTRCPISASAHTEMKRLTTKNPALPVFLVRVIECRQVSNHISGLLALRHESPQAMILRSGKIAWHASHYQISAEEIEKRLAEVVGNC